MIIPVHHIVVMNVPVAATTTFEAGTALGLDGDGLAIASTGANTAAGTCIGLAADRNRAAEATEYVNRISDFGNEPAGSGQVSVYTGGIFYVDIDEGVNGNLTTPNGTVVRGVVADGLTLTPGSKLYSATGGTLTTSASASTQVVAYVLEPAGELSSGIPGEYVPGSSLPLINDAAPRQFVKIKLAV